MTQGSRRHVIAMLGAAVTSALCAPVLAQGPACVDPGALSPSQRSRRRALMYVSLSGDPQKHCSLCAFFAASSSGCGTCQMLSGGAVEAAGVCTSFAKKS